MNWILEDLGLPLPCCHQDFFQFSATGANCEHYVLVSGRETVQGLTVPHLQDTRHFWLVRQTGEGEGSLAGGAETDADFRCED